MEYNEEDGLPFVIEAMVGVLPDNGVALRITYATSEQRFESKEWDVALFAMEAGVAKQLAENLLSCSTGNTGAPAARH